MNKILGSLVMSLALASLTGLVIAQQTGQQGSGTSASMPMGPGMKPSMPMMPGGSVALAEGATVSVNSASQ